MLEGPMDYIKYIIDADLINIIWIESNIKIALNTFDKKLKQLFSLLLVLAFIWVYMDCQGVEWLQWKFLDLPNCRGCHPWYGGR